ncbi:uncharacterized protein LOC128302798 [Anopheles moucheti]|uniref:uncharacterized protein LOC128302798 n=1 Tax=Anopheles moucheti TaxID=186751 RepID=UPI0022F091C3|nr:uncharacterized protein LOC128302798 [Anopheles moucheti]
MDYRDEGSSSSESLNFSENGAKGMIEFIGVENDEETQFDNEISLDSVRKPSAKYGNDVMEDEDDTIDMMMEAEMTKEKFVLMFIESVRNRPILWNYNSRGYRDPCVVQEAWNSLSEQFGIPAKHLKGKWKVLRAQFRNNCAKLRKMQASSDNKNYPTWFAFEAMRFLSDLNGKVEPNASAGSSCVQNKSTQGDENDKQSVILELIQQVKQTPVLWDQSWPLYNTKAGHMAWNTIAKRMNLPVDDLKLKWTTLRSQLRIILNKIKIQSSSGLPVRKPTWYAFEAMQFVLKNRNTNGVGPNFTLEATQPITVTTKPYVPKAVTIKRFVSTTATPEQPEPTPVEVKQHMPDPLTVIHPLPKPVTIKRIVAKPEHLSPMSKPYFRNFKRRYNGSTVTTPPKLVRITSHSSQSTSKPDSSIRPSSSTSSRIDPFIVKTFQNLSKITDKIAQTESTPYSGLLNHLTVVLSKKRASDFNEIEGLLLNCLNELNKFPNATKDPVLDVPPTIAVADGDLKDEEREDSNDAYE